MTASSHPPLKSFDDACGTAHALEMIGERWALLVLRELMLGPRRFGELRADLPGISANILAQRLGELETRGLLIRRKLPPPASVQVYELTAWGYEVEPIVQVMGRWAARSLHHDPTRPISGVSILLSFRTMFDQARTAGFDAVVGFRFGADEYRGHLSAMGFPIARGDAEDAAVTFACAPAVLAAAVYGKVPIAALEADGALAVGGDRALAERFVTLFVLPPKVDA